MMLSWQGRCAGLGLSLPAKSLPGFRPSIFGLNHPKCISLGYTCGKNHYDALGITPHATQTDIKTAYYKLSMMYHPDKNKGSEMASEKFRDISSAYEVLGNFKLRKLYDKGILHTGMRGQYSSPVETDVEDDSTTKFYKARMNRTRPPTPTGRTPIYNFDEWSRSHYGASFARREAAKQKFARKTANFHSDRRDMQKEMVIFGTAFFVIGLFLMSLTSSRDYDIVISKPADIKNSKLIPVPDHVPSRPLPTDS